MIKRVFLLVFDSFGIGEAPDAKQFGDEGSNTLKSIMTSKTLNVPMLKKLGLFNIDGVDLSLKEKTPIGKFGRIQELSKCKDSTTGHWEMAGIITKKPMPTFPNGFPQDVVSKLEEVWDTKILCNKPYSGTQVILDYGQEHIKTKQPIVYTSADSVLQIACHEDVIPIEKLYEMCRQARKIMSGKYAVGRIIARPFKGDFPNFYRTGNRQDFSLEPNRKNLLKILQDKNLSTISIGKVADLFAHKYISKQIGSANNDEGIKLLLKVQKEDFKGLCFVNFCDFDSKYGHRNDVEGYAKALNVMDKALKKFIANMQNDDVLMITADHGCDPLTPSTDHSREYVPILFYYKNIKPVNLGTKLGFNVIGSTILDLFNIDTKLPTLSKQNSLK